MRRTSTSTHAPRCGVSTWAHGITNVRIVVGHAARPPGRKTIAIDGDLQPKFLQELTRGPCPQGHVAAPFVRRRDQESQPPVRMSTLMTWMMIGFGRTRTSREYSIPGKSCFRSGTGNGRPRTKRAAATAMTTAAAASPRVHHLTPRRFLTFVARAACAGRSARSDCTRSGCEFLLRLPHRLKGRDGHLKHSRIRLPSRQRLQRQVRLDQPANQRASQVVCCPADILKGNSCQHREQHDTA